MKEFLLFLGICQIQTRIHVFSKLQRPVLMKTFRDWGNGHAYVNVFLMHGCNVRFSKNKCIF